MRGRSFGRCLRTTTCTVLLLAILSAFPVSIAHSGAYFSEEDSESQVEHHYVRRMQKDNNGKLLKDSSIFEEGLNSGICLSRPEGQRCYDIYIPTGSVGNLPLVLDFHASGSESISQMYMSKFREISRNGKSFVVAWLQGYEKSFNAGVCCGDAESAGIDDVGLVREMIEQIMANVNIDPQRIYATGYSNGGAMAYYLSITLPEYIAAIATIAYGFNTWLKDEALTVRDSPGSAFHPVPVLSIHGSNDQLNCWTSSCMISKIIDPSGTHLNSQEGWHNWAEVNRCLGEPVTIAEKGPSFLPMFDYTDYEWIKAYTNCAGGVEVRQLLNSRNHSGEWLGANGIQTQGDYSEIILEFLFRWTLPETTESSAEPPTVP